MKRWLIPVIAVVIIAVGVGCFFGGRATGGSSTASAKTPTGNSANGFPGANGQTPQGTGRYRGGGNMVAGTIIAADSTSVTVKTSSGSTKIVLYSASTTITKSEVGSAADLKVGTEISASGTSNSDGSVTATRISMGRLQGMPNGTGQTTTTAKG